MPSCPTLALALILVTAVHSLPVDEISARNGIGSATSGVGGQAAGGSVSASASSCRESFTDCVASDFLGTSLLRIASENAGNGGNALSGTSNGKALFGLIGGTNTTNKALEGSGFSGAGGEAPAGSVVNNDPALIELDSDNGGQGGNASSGNSSGLVN